jgi:hypothetical protein
VALRNSLQLSTCADHFSLTVIVAAAASAERQGEQHTGHNEPEFHPRRQVPRPCVENNSPRLTIALASPAAARHLRRPTNLRPYSIHTDHLQSHNPAEAILERGGGLRKAREGGN